MPEAISPVRATRCSSSRIYRFLWLCLVLAFYYNSYRYPLQINSSTTSPYYTDTPYVLQVGKYIIFIFICFWYIFGEHRFRIVQRDLVLFGSIACFACFSLMMAFSVALDAKEPLDVFRTAQDVVFLAIPLLSMGCNTRGNINTIVRSIWVFLLLSMITLALQVILFITIARLPALAYHNSLSVRFGSIWDDPNAFPMMLALFVPLVLFRFTSIAAAILTVGGVLVVIIAAQSLTCVLSVAMGLMAAFVLRLSDRISAAGIAMKASAILFLSLVALVIVDINALKSIWSAWLQEKGPSIAMHVLDAQARFDVHPLSLLGIAPTGMKGESGWLNLLYNQGIFFTALYGMFIVAGIVLAGAAALTCSMNEKGVFYGAFCFQVAFAVSLFVLPNNAVFPLNVIDYILWSIVYIRRRGEWKSS